MGIKPGTGRESTAGDHGWLPEKMLGATQGLWVNWAKRPSALTSLGARGGRDGGEIPRDVVGQVGFDHGTQK